MNPLPSIRLFRHRRNVSFGYLFDHTEVAAQLGERSGVDWIAVGRVHKPSFLFAYLKVRLVNTRTRRVVGDFVVEVKGYLKKLTERGAAAWRTRSIKPSTRKRRRLVFKPNFFGGSNLTYW